MSHAPADTRLKRHSRTGAVAACAARAAASLAKSSRGLAGSRDRMGAVNSAIPQTAANVRTVPIE